MTKLILVILSIVTIAANSSNAKADEIKDSVIKSLIMGINSDNFGLRTSSAHMLGELKCEKAVIPLLRMLKSEKREAARIVAALALWKIGDAKGIFAIERAIRFDRSERVRKLCAAFYQAFYDHSKDSINLATN